MPKYHLRCWVEYEIESTSEQDAIDSVDDSHIVEWSVTDISYEEQIE